MPMLIFPGVRVSRENKPRLVVSRFGPAAARDTMKAKRTLVKSMF